MYLYLYINLAIIIGPLIISFERRRINYCSRIKSVAFSTFCVGTAFVAWDALATSRGHWSFNPVYLVGPKLLGLPFEEILFFITVPFSCLFTYEALAYFVKDARLAKLGKLPLAVGLALALLSVLFVNKEYTFLAMLSVAISVLVAHKLVKDMFSSRLYWLYIALAFTFFFVFNYFLTSLPIVEYSSLATSGLRVTTIPVEDFMFNFSMLTLYLAIHLSVARKPEGD
jgi:lycopene cyclase domain-containing protein